MPTELPVALVTLLGLFAPLVYQTVTRYITSELGRFLCVVALSVLTGVAAMFFSKVPWTFTVEFISILYTFTSIAFKVVWKPLFNGTGVLSVLKAPPTRY